MFVQLCAIFVLLGNIQAFTVRDANAYIEKVFFKTYNRFSSEASYSRLDPYIMEDIEVPLNNAGIQVGTAVLTKGKLINLSKIRRSTDCTVPLYQSANVTFTCFLGFRDLEVTYTVNVSLPNAKFAFRGEADVEGTNVTIQITSNRNVDIPSLNLLFINHIGTAKITAFIKVGHINALTGIPIAEALEKKTLQTLHQLIEGRFKNAVAYSIYRTPVEF